MQDLRYLNLFAKVTGVETRYIFNYNNMLIFCVPKKMISKALGRNLENLKKINEILGKRIRIIALPKNINDVKEFISQIVSPINFNEVIIKDNEIILTAGKNNKAYLIGRDKKLLIEMKGIIKNFFKRDFRVA